MAIEHEINVLGEMLQRAIKEENTKLENVIVYLENGTEHVQDRIGINGDMITDLTEFLNARN